MVLLLQCSSSVHTLVLFLFYILLTSSMEVAFSDARRLPPRLLPDTGGINKVTAANKQEAAARIKWERETEGRRALIGSRPPRCERVCRSCGHCEAVQVPIVPHEQEKARAASAVTLAAAMFTYRVDGISWIHEEKIEHTACNALHPQLRALARHSMLPCRL